MKRVFCLMLAVIMLLSLAACSGNEVQQGTTNPSVSSQPSTPENPTTPSTPGDAGSAADVILMGTPAVDAQLDSSYLQSYCVTVDHTMGFLVPVGSDDQIQAKAYFLHDGENIYVCAVVTGDSAVVNTGLVSWVADAVEIWFSNPAGQSSKIVMDAFATPWPHNGTNDRENKLKVNFSDIELAAVQTDDGYVVEMKVKTPYYRKSEGTVAINVQLNNIYTADADDSVWGSIPGGCYGTQAEKHEPVIVTLSDTPAA